MAEFYVTEESERLRNVLSVLHSEIDSAWCRDSVTREHAHRWGEMIRTVLDSNIQEESEPSRRWVISWRYGDGSGSGVVPWVFSDRERIKVEGVMLELGTDKEYSFVEVSL